MKRAFILLLSGIAISCSTNSSIPVPDITPRGMPLDQQYIPQKDSEGLTHIQHGKHSPSLGQ